LNFWIQTSTIWFVLTWCLNFNLNNLIRIFITHSITIQSCGITSTSMHTGMMFWAWKFTPSCPPILSLQQNTCDACYFLVAGDNVVFLVFPTTRKGIDYIRPSSNSWWHVLVPQWWICVYLVTPFDISIVTQPQIFMHVRSDKKIDGVWDVNCQCQGAWRTLITQCSWTWTLVDSPVWL
jgi:hypothetical protein